MEKRAHQYKLTLEYLKDSKGETISADPVELILKTTTIFSLLSKGRKTRTYLATNNKPPNLPLV